METFFFKSFNNFNVLQEAENALRFYRNANVCDTKEACQKFDQELAKITQFAKQNSNDGEGLHFSDLSE